QYREGEGPVSVGDGQLTVGAIKLWLDGALGSRGAALHAPYCDDPTNRGLILVPPEEVERLTREAASRGFHVWVHAIGDRANTLVLDVFEKVLASPGPRPHLRVEHAQVLDPGAIPRFSRLGVVPSMQPTHCPSDMRWAGERLGPERLQGAYACGRCSTRERTSRAAPISPWRMPIPSMASMLPSRDGPETARTPTGSPASA